MKPQHGPVTNDCTQISAMLQRVGDKWTVLVIGALGVGPQRFSDIKRQVGGISQKMLTSTLRNLERDGFVHRTVTPTRPPRVDYSLSELGADLLVPVQSLGDWTLANMTRIEAARARFDGREDQ